MPNLENIDGQIILAKKDDNTNRKNFFPKTFSKNIFVDNTSTTTLDDKMEDIDTNITTNGQKINTLIDDLSETRTKLNTTDNKIGPLMTDMQQLETDISEANSRIGDLESQLSTINNTVVTKSNHTTDISNINTKIQTINNQIATINTNIQSLNQSFGIQSVATGRLCTNSLESFVNSSSDSRIKKWTDLTTFVLPSKGIYLFTTSSDFTASLLITNTNGTQSASIEIEVSPYAINDTSNGKYNTDHTNYQANGWSTYPYIELHSIINLNTGSSSATLGDAVSGNSRLSGFIKNDTNSSQTWYIRYNISYTGGSTIHVNSIHRAVYEVVKLSSTY